MAKIKVNDIKITGTELFDDSESFLDDLSSDELAQSMGGLNLCTIPYSPFCVPWTPPIDNTLPYTVVIL